MEWGFGLPYMACILIEPVTIVWSSQPSYYRGIIMPGYVSVYPTNYLPFPCPAASDRHLLQLILYVDLSRERVGWSHPEVFLPRGLGNVLTNQLLVRVQKTMPATGLPPHPQSQRSGWCAGDGTLCHLEEC